MDGGFNFPVINFGNQNISEILLTITMNTNNLNFGPNKDGLHHLLYSMR